MRPVKNVSCETPGATVEDVPAMEARRRLHPEERPRGEAPAEGDQGDADRAGDRSGPGARLLREDREGQPAHPEEAHRARDEQDKHEQPAATDAVRGVAEAHPERPRA